MDFDVSEETQIMLEMARSFIEAGGFLQPTDGVALSFGHDTTEHVLRHHELFSSAVEMNLGNVRPLIPLNVDPPLHAKYRKLLDPLFAPKRMDERQADINLLRTETFARSPTPMFDPSIATFS
jgi:cytochrome P450